MKALIQRVLKGSVNVNGEIISSIGRGLVILIGIHRDDTQSDIDYLVRKILNARLFDDESGRRWAKSVSEKQYELLCVSQFTLYYNFKGNKPEFRQAMKTEDSKKFYELFLQKLKKSYREELVKDGVFGAMMEVGITNDGPVTIEIESPINSRQSGEIPDTNLIL